MAVKPAVMPVPPSNAVYIVVVKGANPQSDEGHAKSKAEPKVIVEMTPVVPKLEVAVMPFPMPVIDLDHIRRLIG